jgi:hypothetical protein
MPPKVKGQSKMLPVSTIDRKLAEIVSPRLDAFLRRTAANDKAWATAMKSPKKFLIDNGFKVEPFQDIRFGEELKVPAGIQLKPIRLCPPGYRPILRIHRECVCQRWAELSIAEHKPPFFGLSMPYPIWLKLCYCREMWIGEWTCQRVFHIYPVLPIVRPVPKPKPKTPVIPSPR